MGFFNPALLWFALGGAIPIIIHLLHRQKFKRVRWAAMEFLLAALKKTRRRLQLENLILLLLRILAMILLALAVARPFFHEAPLGAMVDTDTHHIFVIDTSYSMAYKRAQTTSLDVARKAALEVLKDIPQSEQDRFTLLPLNSYPEPILKARNQKAHIQAGISELKTSAYGTSMLSTMLALKTLLEDDKEIKNLDRRIYIFTDLQRVGWEQRDDQEAKRFSELLKRLSHLDRTKFYVYDVGLPDAANVAVVDLRVNDRVVTTKRATRFTAEIHNFSSTPRPSINVHLKVNDSFVKTVAAVLPPRATVPVHFDYQFTEAAPHFVTVSVDPDYLDLDDHRYLALDVKSALRGLAIDGDPGNNPREGSVYPLMLSLDPTRQGLYFSLDVKTVELFNGDGLDAYDFIVLANVQSLTSDKVEKIENFVKRGGGVLIALGSKVDKVSFNESFWNGGKGISPAALEEVSGELPGAESGSVNHIVEYAPTHPIFATFQKQLKGALFGLVFHRFYKTKDYDPEKALARFDDGFKSPLLLEKTIEEGKVLLFTSTIHGEWNNLPAKPPFLPLMWDICRYLAARPSARRNLFIGELIQFDLPVEQYQPPFHLETPVEGVVTLPASPPEKDQKFVRLFYPAKAKSNDPKKLDNEGLRQPGIYKLTRSTPKEEDRRVAYFAVNLPPRNPTPEEIRMAEGNLERISKEEIQRLYPDFKAEFLGGMQKTKQEIDVSPPASGLWKFLLYFLLGFMLLESMLACLFGRGKQ